MIQIGDIKLVTQEDCDEFNSKYKDIKAEIDDEGGISLRGIKNQEHLIASNRNTKLFDIDKIEEA